MSVDLTKIDPSRVSTAPKGKSVDLSTVHPDRISTEPPQEPGIVEHALERLDAYTGAPVRAAVDTMKGDPTNFILGLLPGVRAKDKAPVVEAAKAYKNQLGADAKTAPTPQHLLYQDKVIGPPITKTVDSPKFREAFAKSYTDLLPTDPGYLPMKALTLALGEEETKGLLGKVPKGIAVLGAGAATDPMSYVPATELAKPITKVGGAITKRAAGLLPESASSGIRNTVSRAASQFTGVPKEIWNNYIKRSKEVGELANTYQGENKFFEALKDFRSKMGATVDARKSQLGEMIEKGLSTSSRKPKIPTQPFIDTLNQAKAGLHPETEAGAIKEIDAMIDMIRKGAPEGKMSPWDAYKYQRWFHERAKSAFADAGQIFNPSPQSSRAAKAVRYQLTDAVNKHFPDTIAKANKEFVELHNIDDIIPKSMLDPEGTTAALNRAGIDPNSKEANALAKLSQFLHGDDRLVQDAKDLATFQKVGQMGWMPWSGAGSTSTSRSLLGAGIAGGSQFSDDPEIKKLGLLAGAATTSPAMWKMGVDVGLKGVRGASKVAGKGGLLDKRAEDVRPFIQALERRLNPTLEKGVKAAEDFILDEAGAFTPGQVKGFLNKEGAYDLKKAREVAGPAKGLLPEKSADVIKHDATWRNVTPTDREIAERLGKKLFHENKPLSGEEEAFLERLRNKIGGGRSQNEELYSFKDAIDEAIQKHKSLANAPDPEETAHAVADILLKNKRQGFSGKIDQRDADFLADIANKTQDESLLSKIHEALSPEQPRGLLTNLNVERGPVKELPEGAAKGQIGEIRPTTEGIKGIVHPTEAELDARVAKVDKSVAKIKAEKAAEAKKVVSVDVPGAPKRGRAPETKPEMAYKPRVVPSDLKYKIGEEVMYEGRPVKVVQYDGNGVYTIKKGNMHDQVHMADLKPKGKPTKPKGKK